MGRSETVVLIVLKTIGEFGLIYFVDFNAGNKRIIAQVQIIGE